MKRDPLKRAAEELEALKVRIRPRVEYPFRAVKRWSGFIKVRFKGLAKDTAQVLP